MQLINENTIVTSMDNFIKIFNFTISDPGLDSIITRLTEDYNIELSVFNCEVIIVCPSNKTALQILQELESYLIMQNLKGD